MIEYVVHFVSVNHKTNQKTFKNINDVLAYIDKYEIYQVDVTGEDFGESYTDINEFVELYKTDETFRVVPVSKKSESLSYQIVNSKGTVVKIIE